MPPLVSLMPARNDGYAAAVNLAVSTAPHRSLRRAYTLVATHEVRVRPNAVRLLHAALEADPSVAVAGPTLLIQTSSTEATQLWSTGGYLSRGLNIPAFHDRGRNIAVTNDRPITEREWLDGAFCLYRTESIEREPMDTAYFLYYEETDLHVRLRKSGHKVIWVPAAVVEQRTEGVPPYYWARNLQYFQSRHGRLHQKLFTVPYLILKNLARNLLRRPHPLSTVHLVKAWAEALRPPFAVGWKPLGKPRQSNLPSGKSSKAGR